MLDGKCPAPDVLIGGTPCQAFSVAGLRKSLGEARGNLTLTLVELLDAVDTVRFFDGKPPCTLVGENVPGVLSIDGGRAFGAVLGGLSELGYGWAYRVLDAQFFGIPQRRRRVFVVGCLGDERRAAAVLFERASLSGHPTPRRQAGAIASALTRDGLGGGGADDNIAQANHIVAHTLKAEGFDASEDGTGRGVPLVPVAFALRGREDGAQPEVCDDGDTVGSLRAASGGSSRDYVAFTCKDYGADAGEIAPTLRAMEHNGSSPNGGGQVAIAGTLRHSGSSVARVGNGEVEMLVPGTAARRLTPRECERLQGFPDDYTAVPYRKKPAADGPRYRALGNSMAVPVMAFIGRRIQMVEELNGALS